MSVLDKELFEAEEEFGRMVKKLKKLGYGLPHIKSLADAYYSNTKRLV